MTVTLPPPSQPAVDPNTGKWTDPWWRVLTELLGADGDIAILQAQMAFIQSAFISGNWIPVLAFGGTADSTYTVQEGQYVQAGNLVCLWASIILTNNGTGTGAATISGFHPTPGQAESTAGLTYVGVFGDWQNISNANRPFHCAIDDSLTDTIQLFRSDGADASVALDDTDIDNDAVFNIAICYKTG